MEMKPTQSTILNINSPSSSQSVVSGRQMADRFTDPGEELLKDHGWNVCFLIQMPLMKRGGRYFDRIT